MKRTLSEQTTQLVGKPALVQGWVHSRRDHGGLIFIDMRDHTGIVQLTINSKQKDIFADAESLRDEFVIEAAGTVKKRDKDLVNKNIPTGEVEIVVEKLRILNRSDALPIQVNSDQNIGEEHRLRYRYLDLRRPKMQEMLKKRADYYAYMRAYMEKNEFTEITTPVLANSSPEGARDFLVPSRAHPGMFYALPQAPQQFKQLLMVGGVPRYYQFATCFRDEDPRADRFFGDFYQLDLEMSFVEDGEVVRSTMEPLMKDLVTDFGGKKLKFGGEVPRLTFAEAMDRFGTDKPDMRYDMELVDLTDELKDCGFGVFSSNIKGGGVVKAIAVGKQFSRSEIDKLTDMAKREGAGGLPYLSVEDGKATSSIAKFFNDEELETILKKTGAKNGDMIFFGSDTREKVNKVLGVLRSHFGDVLELKDPDVIAAVWVLDFPMYEIDEKTGKMDISHNPFSMPKGGIEAFKTDDKLSIVADQYDMVMNGYEVCSGAVRNHNLDIMYEAFGALGYSREQVEEKFGGMLNAFKFGAPPHAGCAFGVDRIFMVLTGEENIRNVIAFPKNGSGVDLMMNSPGHVDDALLDELSLKSTAAED